MAKSKSKVSQAASAKTDDVTPPTRKSKSKSKPPITRDVGPQSKGPRLQRLRAVQLLIEAAATYPDSITYVAVEFQGDVFCSKAEANGSDEYHEENKNFAPTVAFTMNSDEITNSLVAFVDCWLSKACSKNVRFGFYCPNAFTKENQTAKSQKLGITWPTEPVLKFLSAGDYDPPNVLASAKLAILAAYEEQAKQHGIPPANGPSPVALANLETIKKWSDEQWRDFFKQIQWKFGEDDAASIEQTITNAIQASPLFNEQLNGKERQIVAVLLDLIDKRQQFKDPTQRLLQSSEVLLCFKNVETGAVRLPDPAWKMWEALPAPVDTRNLAGKVNAVCTTVDTEAVSRWSRRAAHSLIEQRELADDKQVLALKYQVYDVCEEKLADLLKSKNSGSITHAEISEVLGDLVKTANDRVDVCSQQYQYKLKSGPSIQGMVYELFGSCFLRFDGGQSA